MAVIIQRLDAETRSPGGIVIPHSAAEKPIRGNAAAVNGRVTLLRPSFAHGGRVGRGAGNAGCQRTDESGADGDCGERGAMMRSVGDADVRRLPSASNCCAECISAIGSGRK
jgi:hypothetical protein